MKNDESDSGQPQVGSDAVLGLPDCPGTFEFRGIILGGRWLEDQRCDEWTPAEVFMNNATKRLNARVNGCADNLGGFEGEWRWCPNANEHPTGRGER